MLSFKMLTPRVIVLLVFVLSPAAPASAADCTLTQFSQVQDVVSNCTDIVVQDLTVPGGESLELDLQTGTTLTFQGQIVFNVSNGTGPVVRIKGDQLKIEGLAGHVINGQGIFYWESPAGNNALAELDFLSISDVQNSTFSGINLLNCPFRCVSVINSNDVALENFTVDVSEANGEGVNIVGFNVTNGTNVLIKNSVVKNRDDCLVVNQGANYILQDLVCEAGDGLSFSIGFGNISISQNNTDGNVTVQNSAILNSEDGIRLKTIPNIQGTTIDIVYSNISIQGLNNFGMIIDRSNTDNSAERRLNIPIKKLRKESAINIRAGVSLVMDVGVKCSSGCELQSSFGDDPGDEDEP